MSLLLTNGMLRMTLAAARSVGSLGIPVGVGDTTGFTPSGFSKYCTDRWVYPDPVTDPDAFLDALLERIEKREYRVFFPMDIPAIEIAIKNRKGLETLCHLPLPPTESFRIAMDKGLSAVAALKAGIDAPKTELPASLEDVSVMARKLGFPVVVKPRVSSGSRGIRIVRNEQELEEVYEEVHRTFPLPILQEFIPTGERYDVCFLYDRDGQLKASFAQREIRHFPHPIGPSTMQESVWIPELTQRAKDIMELLPWSGVVELEFMVDPRDGLPKFMEINPRFWNSLYLAVRSGIDFPTLLYRDAVGEAIGDVHTYRVGQKARTLIPGELLHFVTNPGRFNMNPPLWAGRGAGGEDDVFSLKDPLPSLGLIAACARHLFDRNMWGKLLDR